MADLALTRAPNDPAPVFGLWIPCATIASATLALVIVCVKTWRAESGRQPREKCGIDLWNADL
jgi:hypothetical protein